HGVRRGQARRTRWRLPAMGRDGFVRGSPRAMIESITMDLRHEALLMLDKRGAVLETARTISRIMRQHHVPGAIIGGVAVVLHGHVRTTKDVDVLVQQPLEQVR